MRRTIVGLFAFVAICAAQAASATDYYVSTSGSDSNAGTSSQPWATIGHAVGYLQAGDTLHVGPGDYNESDEIAGLQGTAQAPITILGNGQPRITATGRDVFLIWEGCQYLVLDGLELTGGTRSGAIVNGSTYVTFSNCTIHDNAEWGVQTVLSDHISVEGCEVYNCASQHGIYFSTTDHPSAIGNVIHDCYECGIHLNGDISEGGDGMITGATIEGNVIYNCGAGGGAAINMDSVEDSLIANNLIFNNHAGGITSFHQDGLAAGQNNEFYYNTVYFVPGTGRYALQLYSGSTNATVEDNILDCSKMALDIDSASMPGLASDYNILCRPGSDMPIGGDTYYTLAQWQAATGNDLHSLTSAPDFVNAAGDDFHLTATSPGVDAGVAVPGITTDIEGTTRPQGAAVDMGAYETAGPTTNHAPVANPDSATTAQDTPVKIDVLSNDTDADGDALSVAGVTTPVHGSAVVNADQTVTYTPVAGWSGTDTFDYTATDGTALSSPAAVTVTVTPAPVQTDAVHVQSIQLSVRQRHHQWQARALVTVVDENGSPVKGAMVSGEWQLNGNPIGGAGGSTNHRGQAAINSPRVSASSGDVFTFTVTGISAKGYTYDPSADAEQTASVTVP